MLLEVNFPPDSRVEKEMISLSQDGHDVFLACITHDKTIPRIEKTEHYTIYRKYIGKKTFKKLSALVLILPYYFLWWKKFAKSIFSETNFDAIHIHDLPLSKIGYYFKRKFGKRFICDQHEFYSDWIINTAHMNTIAGKIVSAFSNWSAYEKKHLSLADLVITVAEPLRENYVRKYNLPKEQIITIPNTPTNNIFNKENILTDIVSRYSNEFVIFYAGGIDILRGIDTAIIALQEIKKHIPNVKLVLGGKIIKPYSPLKTAEEYGVSDYIEFIGWIDEKELPSYISASKICFFTPPANREEVNKTIATKIYQYAIMQRPMIVSDAKMMKEYVETNNLGISIESENSDQFANAVLKIYSDNDSYTKDHQKNDWYWDETVKPMCVRYGTLKALNR